MEIKYGVLDKLKYNLAFFFNKAKNKKNFFLIKIKKFFDIIN